MPYMPQDQFFHRLCEDVLKEVNTGEAIPDDKKSVSVEYKHIAKVVHAEVEEGKNNRYEFLRGKSVFSIISSHVFMI
jgi:hypothetical protein